MPKKCSTNVGYPLKQDFRTSFFWAMGEDEEVSHNEDPDHGYSMKYNELYVL